MDSSVSEPLEARSPHDTKLTERVRRFLAARSFAVVGVSADLSKYGRKVYEALRQSGRDCQTYGINPKLADLEGSRVYPNIASLPLVPEVVVAVTPPPVTAAVVAEAIRLGVPRIWMQPHAENMDAVRAAREAGLEVIYGGACVIVALGLEWSEQEARKAEAG